MKQPAIPLKLSVTYPLHGLLLIFIVILNSDIHRFAAQGIANKIWYVIVFIVFYKYFLISFKKVNFYIIYIYAYVVIGLLNNNPIGFIITDFSLLILPLVFWSVGNDLYHKNINLESFVNKIINISVYILPVSIVANLLYKIPVYVDYVLLLSVLIYSSKPIKIKDIFVVLSVLLAFSNYKVFLIQLVSLLAMKVKYLFIGIVVLILLIPIYDFIIQNSESIKKMMLFISELDSDVINQDIRTFLDYPSTIFSFFDISTSQRIYELLLIINSFSDDIIKILLGNGLGGYVNMENTGDHSVISAHGDDLNVRVFHLAVSYVLAKFGLIGVIISSFYCLYFIKLTYQYTKSRKYDIPFIYTVIYFIGVSFTFAPFLKFPIIYILLSYVYQDLKSIKTRMLI